MGQFYFGDFGQRWINIQSALTASLELAREGRRIALAERFAIVHQNDLGAALGFIQIGRAEQNGLVNRPA